MIPRKFTGEMLKGRKATLERDIRNVAGVAIGKGATVTITEVVRGSHADGTGVPDAVLR